MRESLPAGRQGTPNHGFAPEVYCLPAVASAKEGRSARNWTRDYGFGDRRDTTSPQTYYFKDLLELRGPVHLANFQLADGTGRDRRDIYPQKP